MSSSEDHVSLKIAIIHEIILKIRNFKNEKSSVLWKNPEKFKL